MAWNTDGISVPLITLPAPEGRAIIVEANLGMGKLFTSYSQGVGFLPAVRRENIFQGVSRQENLACHTDIYF